MCVADAQQPRSRAPAHMFWRARPHTCLSAAQMPCWARPPNGKLSTACMPAKACKWEARPLTCTRPALHTCLPNSKHTRSRAPAQHCAHACYMSKKHTCETALVGSPHKQSQETAQGKMHQACSCNIRRHCLVRRTPETGWRTTRPTPPRHLRVGPTCRAGN